MSDSNPKTVYQRLIITGQNVTSEVKHDSEKRKNRVTTSTRPISMKTKIISSPISDTRNRKAGTQNEEKSQHGKGKKKKEEKMLKVGAWNMPVSATQPHLANVNLTNLTLEEEKLDILGIIECNIYQSTNRDSLQIKGYELEIGRGIEKKIDGNARVACYISNRVHYNRRKDLEEKTEMPTIWIELELPRTKKILLGIVYREFKEWGGEDLGLWNQHERWRRWLESLKEVWEGKTEAIVMGDFNIDLGRRETGKKADMQKLAKTQLLQNGWKQMLNQPTRRVTRKDGKTQESAIDWIATNNPGKYTQTGVKWMGTGADHALIWTKRNLIGPVAEKRWTQRRMWKNFTKDKLEEEANRVNWNLAPTKMDRNGLEEMVEELEGKIKEVMDKVAPMKVVEVKQKLSNWITPELKRDMKEARDLQRNHRLTGKREDGEAWKTKRRQVSKDLRKAKKISAHRGLRDKTSHSKSMWQGVKTHLGWESTGAPKRLIKLTEMEAGNTIEVIKEPGGICEEITQAFEAKAKKVKESIGRTKGNYLKQTTTMHKGNIGKFSIGEITEKDVRKRLRGVKNKPSFGEDEISYADLKLLAKWVEKPLADVFTKSLKQGEFPKRWKTSRIKPLWKGEGNPKESAKSYRPVALLSAMGRLMEGVIAERMDLYSETRGLVHKQVHGFRKNRGVGTGMLRLWEDVMKEGGGGKKIVAMAFVDVSAGFDSVPHTQLMRKLEVIGYDKGALKWLSDYLSDRCQYVVVEATNGRRFEMPVGTPQGGALGPTLWREYTNDLPESITSQTGDEELTTGENCEEEHHTRSKKEGWTLSDWVDSKNHQGEEEDHDRKLRQLGKIKAREREGGLEGPDRLRYQGGKREGGGNCILYADDTSATQTGELWPQLEVKLMRMLKPLFEEMKLGRLKVNEEKTGLILLGSRQARRKLLEGGGRRRLTLAGEEIVPKPKAKSLGLVISEDMNWTDEVEARLAKCSHKLRSLMRLKGIASQEQKKTLAQGVIMSRLQQHLEVISMGRRVDLTALQRMQNKTMRWIRGEGMRAFRAEDALEGLGWLDIGQHAAKATIITALKVLYEGKQEDLLDRIAVKDKRGAMKVKNVSKGEFLNMNTWMRKAWSTRARRWLKKIPQELLNRNPWLDGTKKAVRSWVRTNVKTKGEDAILWGKWEEDDLECERLEEGTCPKPYWTEKQMRRRGEPQRKKMRRENQNGEEEGEEEKEDKEINKKMKTKVNTQNYGAKKENATEEPQGKISMKAKRQLKTERRERWRIKKAIREKNRKERERKQKERKEAMVMKGTEKTRTQYTLRMWAIGGGPLGKEGTEKEKENARNKEDKEHRGEGKGDNKKGIG